MRQQFAVADRAAREKLAAQSDYLLGLPDEFYSGHVDDAKNELADLQRRLQEAQELETEKAVVQV